MKPNGQSSSAPAGGPIPSAGGRVPSVGGPISSAGGPVPSAGGPIPSSGGPISSAGETVASAGDFLPSAGDPVPQDPSPPTSDALQWLLQKIRSRDKPTHFHVLQKEFKQRSKLKPNLYLKKFVFKYLFRDFI